MNPLHFPQLRHVLCLGAHADDIEIGCGGTLLHLLQTHPDVHVSWVVLSAEGPRRTEAQRSADSFLRQAGSREIHIADFTDCFFPAQWQAIKHRFAQWSADWSPDLVLTHRLEDRHQDHRVVAELTWNAFRNHTVLEYEIPKYEGDLGTPNLYVPLAAAICQDKLDRLMAAFPSQADKYWFAPETFWALLRLRGLECRSSSHLAEGFTARKLQLSA